MRVRRLPFQGPYTVMAACDGRGAPTLLEFFDSLGPNLEKDMDHMLALLERVSANGPPRNTDISHKIQGDIWEFVKGRLRVFWFYDAGRIIVCTHGLIKQSQKIPGQEIARAELVCRNYFTAKEAGRLMVEDENDG